MDQTSTNQHASANITLIRHGEPVGGTRYRGRTNDPLSQLGWRQMHNANLTAAYWHQILSSPLNRCLDFARYIANSQHTRVEQSADFAEINFGEWEGKTAAELTLHDPMNFSIFLNNPLDYTPPKGENVLNFSQRIISAWENVINNLQAGEKILLVTHGGSIRVILHHILGLPLSSIMKIHVPYACVSKIVVDLPYHNTTECRLASHAANNTQLAQ